MEGAEIQTEGMKKTLVHKITAENSPSLKTRKFIFKTLKRNDLKRTFPRYTIIKTSKLQKNNKNHINSYKRKHCQCTFTEKLIIITSDLSAETLKQET